jgi:hypothetical protein
MSYPKELTPSSRNSSLSFCILRNFVLIFKNSQKKKDDFPRGVKQVWWMCGGWVSG